MKSKSLALNWPYVALVAVLGTSTMLFISGAVTWQVYREWSNGIPITGGFSWPIVTALNFACLMGIVALYRKIYCDARTLISEQGLTQPALFGGTRAIAWADVTKVEIFGGVGIHVFAGKQRIVVTPYAYSRPNDLVELLRVHGGTSQTISNR
jgi:hypothetical protein